MGKWFSKWLKRIDWNRLTQWTANKFFLSVSISLTISFFLGMTEDLIFRRIMPVMVTVIESQAQNILSRGRYYRKVWKETRDKAARRMSWIMIFLYVWYLSVFGFFSGMAYFITTLKATEKTIAQQEMLERITLQEWEVNIGIAQALTGHLETESETGYGFRSQSAMSELNKTKEELQRLKDSLAVTEPVTFQDIDQFQAVAEVFGWPGNVFKIFIFGTLVAFNYIGLILTNPDYKPVTKRNERGAPTEEPVTRLVTQDVTPGPVAVTPAVPVTEYSTCPVCNSKFPAVPNKEYCDEACKQKAYRLRKKQRKENNDGRDNGNDS